VQLEHRSITLYSQSGPDVTESVDKLVVCIPTFNEAENIRPLIAAVLRVTERFDIAAEILVVDDGSPDGTGLIADEIAASDSRAKVMHRTAKEGIGPAYLAGFQEALDSGATIVIQMDCDFSHDPEEIPRLIAETANADLVIGSRYVPGGGVENWSRARQILSRGGCFYARKMLGVQILDLTGGYKCWRAAALRTVLDAAWCASGYAFQINSTYAAIQRGLVVRETPILFREREAGSSKMSTRIVLEAALAVPRIRVREARSSRRIPLPRTSDEAAQTSHPPLSPGPGA
jgi:dolichol-phosphate mannosyltransferase